MMRLVVIVALTFALFLSSVEVGDQYVTKSGRIVERSAVDQRPDKGSESRARVR